ncbi:MAG: TldD/PmbA family protein [Lachnospiraceae bacterium]|nr:TldD/PmbA family protein [Lachnospiraceae bacterium]
MVNEKLVELAEFTVEELLKAGNDEGQVFITESEVVEIAYKNGEYNTCSTAFQNDINVIVMKDHKKGAHFLNKANKEAALEAVKTATEAMEAAEVDEANKIAPNQGLIEKTMGVLEPDLDKLFERMEELRATVEKEYPLISVGNIDATYSKRDMVYKNTSGTLCKEQAGSYYVGMQFAGKDGEKITSLNSCGVSTYTLDKPIIDCSDFRLALEQMEKQLDAVALEGKFTGTVMMNTGAVDQFVNYLKGVGTSGAYVLDGTSVWLDKIGEQVTSEKLSVRLDPHDERIVRGETLTFDGFKSEAYDVIENGVLKNYMIDYYISEKTGYKKALNLGNDMIIKAGDVSYQDMIKNIKKGILIDGFSGGYPAVNGDFSGVVKNGFLIEDGKISNAITETMISGNLFEMFKNIKDVSKELVCEGWGVTPYMSFDGVVISGK